MAGKYRQPTGTYLHDGFESVYFSQGPAVYPWQASVAGAGTAASGGPTLY